MTGLELASLAATNGYRFKMHLSKEEVREHEKKVKRGEMAKGNLAWPWLSHGTCIKLCYVNLQRVA